MVSFLRSSRIDRHLVEEAGDVGRLIVEATSEFRGRASWDINVKIIDAISKISERASNFGGSSYHQLEANVKIIWKRLMSKEIKTVLLTLELVDALVKNCGINFHKALSNSKDFIALMKKHCLKLMKGVDMVSRERPIDVQRKALEIVQIWGQDFSRSRRRKDSEVQAGKNFVSLYEELKRKGAEFPERDIRERARGSTIFLPKKKRTSSVDMPVPRSTTAAAVVRGGAQSAARPCLGGCGFELPVGHSTGYCSVCTKNGIASALRTSTSAPLSGEIACKGGCGFKLPVSHSTGYCSVCSKRRDSSSSSSRRTESSASRAIPTASAAEPPSTDEFGNDDGDDDSNDLDLFFGMETSAAAPAVASSKHGDASGDGTNGQEDDDDIFRLPPPPTSAAAAKPPRRRKRSSDANRSSTKEPEALEDSTASAIADLDLSDVFS
eukprot:g986.t1